MLAWRSLFSGGVFATHLSFVGLGNYSDALSQGGTQALQVTAISPVGFVVPHDGLRPGYRPAAGCQIAGCAAPTCAFHHPACRTVGGHRLDLGQPLRPRFRIVNRILSAFGIPQGDFTSSPSLAFLTVLTFGVWQFFGECVILYLAALKTLPLT